MILAIIPVRGGSNGIKHKNVVPVAGKPLLGWTIEQAQASNLVEKVVVTTDADEIAFLCGHYGCDLFRRSPETATDTASSESALQEVLASGCYQNVKLVVFLQATSPCRQARDIDRAIDTLLREDADSLFSARRVHGYTWERRPSGTIIPKHSQRLPRQQEQVERYEENGSIYVFKPWVLDTFGNRIGGKVAIHVMDPLDSFQIDEPGDIQLLEQLMRWRLDVS